MVKVRTNLWRPRSAAASVLLGVAFLLVIGGGTASAAAPIATIDANLTTGYSSSQGTGQVRPEGHDVAVYVDYRLQGSGNSWSESFVRSVQAAEGPTSISYGIADLLSSTAYEVRLDAFTEGVDNFSAEPNPTFTTKVVSAPILTLNGATNVSATSARLSGAIAPNAPEPAPTSADVEGGFAVHWTFECAPETNCMNLGGVVPADNVNQPVEAEASGLLPGTTYEVFLSAENGRGLQYRERTGSVTFTTPATPPTILQSQALSVNVGATEATVTGEINPGGSSTTYRVEYGPTSSYGDSTPMSGPIGSDNAAHNFSAVLANLAPGSSYHYRVVAVNTAGSSVGPDHNIITTVGELPAFLLPDNRAYEQVTPSDKGGASAQAQTGAVMAAVGGDGFVFMATSTLPGSEGAQEIGNYLAIRGSENWSTQGLLPPASIGREGRVLTWSENLDYSYVESFQPGRGFTYYQRTNATRALTPMLTARTAEAHPVQIDAAGSHVLIEATTQQPLTSGGAPAASNLYVWNKDADTVHLVGVLNSGSAPAGGAFLGPVDWLNGDTFGGGIGRKYYTETAVSEEGETVYFTAGGTGELYVRKHALAAQSTVDAEGKCTEPQAACTMLVSRSQAATPDPEGAKPAAFLIASTIGPPKAIFASSEKLTSNATTGPSDEGFDMYRYEANSDNLTDLVPDTADPNGAEVRGVLGGSADGSTIFFVANGVLGDGGARGATLGNCPLFQEAFQSGECNLYIWEASSGIHFITKLDAAGPGTINGGLYQSDALNWLPRRAGLGQTGSATQKAARVSGNGETLIFRSQRRLTSYPNEGVPEFYRYDAESRELLCVSCARSGASPITAPSLFSASILQAPTNASLPALTRNLSADGKRFFFESTDKLVPGDVNGDHGCPLVEDHVGHPYFACQDVYEWESTGTGTCPPMEEEGCISLISSGTSPAASFLGDVDRAGKNVFFYTEQQLVNQDKDQLVDVYDAREGGGLASQDKLPPHPCTAETTCRQPTESVPVETLPGSAALVHPDHHPRRCKRATRKVKRGGRVVCVPVHHKKKVARRKLGKRSQRNAGRPARKSQGGAK